MSEPLRAVRTPWRIGGLELPHRLVMGSMHTGRESEPEAFAAFYRERAEGGAALMVTGGLAVNSEARGGPDYVVLSDPSTVAGLAQGTEAIHRAGGRIAAQLFHAGRYAVGDWAVAPSPIPWKAARGLIPREMTEADIERTIDDFGSAAAAARTAGFDAVEIMASEGYLINQFLSPLTNQRQDSWGGDAGARMRFPLAVYRAVRQAVGVDFPVMLRLSVTDLMPGSSTDAEIDAFAEALASEGIDAISTGVGWHESSVPTVQSSVPYGVWVVPAERVADVVHAVRPELPIIAGGRIVDVADAERVLARGHVDAIAMARPFLADPRIIERSFSGSRSLVSRCIGCDQACIDRSLVFQPVSCLVNPRAGQEAEFALTRTGDRRHIAVVGGGPAGLAAAEDLVSRGHRVTLFERGPRPGGQFLLAARVPGKEDYGVWVESAMTRLTESGAEIRLSEEPAATELAEYDGVIVATGVIPRRISVPGSDLPHVIDYEQALRHGVPDGPVAVIGGGGIGVDVAETLIESRDRGIRNQEFAQRFDVAASPIEPQEAAERLASDRGADVTLMRRAGRFGSGTGITSRWVHLATLKHGGVRMISDLEYVRIADDGVEIMREGQLELIPARTVIVCAGQERHDPYSEALANLGVRCELIGGALDASAVDAVRATSEGLAAARRITAIQ